MDLTALAQRAAGLVRPGRRVVLGLAGMPGAGKSTMAAKLVEHLNASLPPAPPGEAASGPDWVALLPLDGFHLPQSRLVELGLRDRMGAPETFDAAAYVRVIGQVTGGRDPVSAPAFDRTVEEPQPGGIRIELRHRLVVTEGNYLLLPDGPWPAARRRMAEVWYLRLDEPVRLQRLVTRHVQFGKSPTAAAAWVAGVDQPNSRLVERYAGAADLVVDV